MTRRIALVIGVAAPWTAALAQDAKARQESDRILLLIDDAKYSDCWKRASQHHRSHVDGNEWQTQIKKVRETTGKLGERKFTVARPVKVITGFPDGEYMILEYTTDFANKPKAVETIVLSREGGGWKLVGYTIR
jgi:hypothetical protein